MFRQYEDPYALEERLEKAEAKLEELKALATEDDTYDDAYIDAYIEVQELKDRINFAWQDIEYDECYA